jgi:hypothetical protein
METLASYPCIPGFQSSGLELPGCAWLAISRGSYHAAEIETGFGQQGAQEETFRANRAPGSGGREKDEHGGGEKKDAERALAVAGRATAQPVRRAKSGGK